MVGKARVEKRLYYKIGEACKALGIQPYVLRYWETEFSALAPSKSRSGQRVYSEKEIEIIRRIKELLYGEGYTIAGAKKKLEVELASGTLGDKPEEAEPVSEKGDESPEPAAAETPRALPKPSRAAKALLLREDAPAVERDAPPSQLDTGTADRIQTLRSGIAKALDEAREILALLEKPR
ncbi:MAG TPA: MerR family transcriptional regulator [Thermoanaerobaculia bacterium]|nr:MerR family transcriptional regulator [Thermoanaerobaculia bacterium]